MAEPVKCPNCAEVAQRVGNVITCQACDSIFKITRTGSAKVTQVGWKEEIEERLGILEVGLADEPAAETELIETDPNADADANDDILPR